MLNINQIKRHEGVFSSNTEAIDYVIKNTKSLYGEPLIVEYGDPDAPSVILAIGSKTNEVSGPDEIVRSFNRTYGADVLVEPEIYLPSNEACLRLPGTDGQAKMSKSLGNTIYLSDDEETLRKKVMSMFTDPGHLRIEDPGKIEGNTVFTYLDAFCKPDAFEKYLPEYKDLDELKAHYRRGGLGDVKVKKFLFKVLNEFLTPIRERRAYYEAHPEEVIAVLMAGTEEARKTAAQTLADVKRAMKIDYFESWKEEFGL